MPDQILQSDISAGDAREDRRHGEPVVGRPPLIPAVFRHRLHRFAVEADLRYGRRVTAHLGDPGRLKELLIPGAELRLRPVAPDAERKTRWTVALVRASTLPRVWVSVDTPRANRLAEELLARGMVRGAAWDGTLRREVTQGSSRFDFLLEGSGRKRLWIEVKSVTLVEEGVGRFPDAPTVRGRRHVQELRKLARRGQRAMVLFVVQRGDARVVRPHRIIDPAFAKALTAARRAGVLLRAASFRFDAAGEPTYLGPLPVRL